MKAIIMAGGRGANLEPFTSTRPTTMVYISGQPVLEYIVALLKKAGINDCVIVVGHKGQVIKDYFKDVNYLDANMEFVEQGESNDIGEALARCEKIFLPGEYFLLVYADVISSSNIYSTLLQSFHTFRQPMASICLTPSTQNYGNVFLGPEMRITRLVEKPIRTDLGNYVLSGVFILPQQFFTLFFWINVSFRMDDALNLLIQEMGLRASIWEDPWLDIRYPWDILTGNKMLMDS